jgi:hypothetical protein
VQDIQEKVTRGIPRLLPNNSAESPRAALLRAPAALVRADLAVGAPPLHSLPSKKTIFHFREERPDARACGGRSESSILLKRGDLIEAALWLLVALTL